MSLNSGRNDVLNETNAPAGELVKSTIEEVRQEVKQEKQRLKQETYDL